LIVFRQQQQHLQLLPQQPQLKVPRPHPQLLPQQLQQLLQLQAAEKVWMRQQSRQQYLLMVDHHHHQQQQQQQQPVQERVLPLATLQLVPLQLVLAAVVRLVQPLVQAVLPKVRQARQPFLILDLWSRS